MGHHQDRQDRKENKSDQITETNSFLDKNDVKLLSMIMPLLSTNGQKLVGFCIKFSEPDQLGNGVNLLSMIKQLSSKGDLSPTTDLLPILMNVLSGSEHSGTINPALLTNLLSLLNSKQAD